MKKELWVIVSVILIIWIISTVTATSSKVDVIEKNINENNKRVDNLLHKNFKINDYAKSVYNIQCDNKIKWTFESWTVFFINYEWKKYWFTNNHLTWWADYCTIVWLWIIDSKQYFYFNNNSDFVWFPIDAVDTSETKEKINTMDLKLCNKIQQVTNKIWTIWFPSYWHREKWSDLFDRTTTDWVITWYTTQKFSWFKQSHLNYFVSNKNDFWSSGWPAIAETDDWFCLLWINSWANEWSTVNQTVIQNNYNVIEKE